MPLHGPLFIDHRLLLIGLATGLATLGGGVLAIRLKARLSALAALGAGTVISIALVDLLPEAIDLGRNLYAPHGLLLLTLLGFMIYAVLDRLNRSAGRSPIAMAMGPASLVLHSLMDGIGIGLAFGVSASVGLTVASAVVAHDLLDGSNTVTLSVSAHPSLLRAWGWLALDAAAPLAGLALSLWIAPPPTALPPMLAVFAGFFLFIGAGELLPRSRVSDSGPLNPTLTVLGAALVAFLAWLGAP